ncbi:hypothetical protein [Rhodococcus pyridinivorans]|uniref:hypothetical protein n=1 Tax=Rhodococcus pyridinivorans TaxID=103816 RepID=UPI00158696A5|nr:hypothetical protein [Rhodococcus pyridinivorans]
MFTEHTPDPAAFSAYIDEMKVLNIEDQQITDEQTRSITANTMVIVGDADGVKPEHAVTMFRLLGGGDEEAATTGMLQKIPRARLMILPAMSHLGISGEADVLAPSDGVPRRRPAGDAGALLIWPAALSRRGSAASRRW